MIIDVNAVSDDDVLADATALADAAAHAVRDVAHQDHDHDDDVPPALLPLLLGRLIDLHLAGSLSRTSNRYKVEKKAGPTSFRRNSTTCTFCRCRRSR
jgi:hypothetical protein